MFLMSPLLKDFGEIGVDQPAFKAMLAGTCIPPLDCDPMTVKLLQTLQHPKDLLDIQLSSVEEFSQGWQKA